MMLRRAAAALWLGALLSLAAVGDAKLIEGSVSGVDWAYLGKFCFDTSDEGTWGFVNISITTTQTDVVVLLYSDAPQSWPAIAPSGVSCMVKSNASHVAETLHVTPGGWQAQVHVMPEDEPQFAFVAVSTVDCEYQMELQSFSLLFINPPDSQFSVDEYGVVDLYCILAAMYIVGLAIHFYGHCRRDSLFSLAVRCFTGGLTCTTVAMLSLAIHYGAYGSNGVGAPFLESIGRLLGVVARLSVLAMCVVITSGYGIITGKLSAKDNWVAIALYCAVLLMYFATLIWYEVAREPWSNEYVYDSGYGALLAMLDILFVSLWVWRLRVLHATETHAVRRRFYFRIGAAGAFSFAVLPLTVIVGALVVPYARKRTVYALQSVLVLGVNLGLSYVLFPTNSDGVFVRVSSGRLAGGYTGAYTDDNDGAALLDGDEPGLPSRAGFVSLDPQNMQDTPETEALAAL